MDVRLLLIFRLASDKLDNNILIGICNKRGCHFVIPEGVGELKIVEQFEQYLDKRRQYPRIVKILNSIIKDFWGMHLTEVTPTSCVLLFLNTDLHRL